MYYRDMLKIRLQRVGRKHDPAYRVVLIEAHRAPQSGAAKEILGNYEPRRKTLVLKKDRIDHWVSKGAQPSQTVKDLIRRSEAKK